MPYNLTIINLLTPPSTTPLIVFGSTLLGAFAGGAITYFVAYQRQKYELRRDAYFAFLDLLIEGRYPGSTVWSKNPQFKRDLYIAHSKIDLTGSKKIKEISTKMILTLYPDIQTLKTLTMSEKATEALQFNTPDKWKAFENICDEDLKPAIRRELERWWQFWK